MILTHNFEIKKPQLRENSQLWYIKDSHFTWENKLHENLQLDKWESHKCVILTQFQNSQ